MPFKPSIVWGKTPKRMKLRLKLTSIILTNHISSKNRKGINNVAIIFFFSIVFMGLKLAQLINKLQIISTKKLYFWAYESWKKTLPFRCICLDL